MSKHKVFISYHHDNDQEYKNQLIALNSLYDIFIDGSVDTGDISDDLSDEQIRKIIRDDYLKDTSVTILLVGTETKKRKHIDWELYSSMYDGTVNKKSGILVIQLPTINPNYYTAPHGEKEKQTIYPSCDWSSITTRSEYESRYPYLPERIIDNLIKNGVKISVTRWNDLNLSSSGTNLQLLIDLTYNDRASCSYDLSRAMRRKNS